jgi:GAF domain-containing protein
MTEVPPASSGDADAADPATNVTDPLLAFAELGRINLSQADLGQVLTRVASLAASVIPGADEVSVTLVSGGVAGTATFTGEVAMSLDESQYDSGYGPCLDAAAQHAVFVVDDMTRESRWPAFAAAAVERGVRSSLSVGIPIQEKVSGAINIYGLADHAFDADAVALAQTFAGYAAVAMANAHLYSTTAALAEQMAEAMSSRAVIEQAKGILMAQRGVSAQEAFDILSRASQAANRKLRDIAEAMVERAARSSENSDS